MGLKGPICLKNMFLFQTEVITNANANVAPDLANEVVRVGNDVAHAVNNINWASPTWDLFIVLFFIVAVFLYGLSLGRDRVIVILVAIYMALAVITNAPFLGSLRVSNAASGQLFAFKVAAFIGIFIVLFFLLSRSAMLKNLGGLASGTWWQVLMFSIFHVGLLVSILLSLLPLDAINHLAPLTRTVFASDGGRFIWIVSPIVGMALMKGE